MFLFFACSIPDAPQTLDLLGSDLFSEYENPDPRYMEQGVENVRLWVEDNREDVQEGYRIENLSYDAIRALDLSEEVTLDGLIGAAVATDISLPLEDTISFILTSEPTTINPDAYAYFSRVWEGEGDVVCFLAKDCQQINYSADTHGYFPLGIEMISQFYGQYRWVSTQSGDYVVQRRWLTKPCESNVDWFGTEQDYAITVYMPTETGMRFMDMEWIVTHLGDIPVPEDFALGLAIDTIKKNRKGI